MIHLGGLREIFALPNYPPTRWAQVGVSYLAVVVMLSGCFPKTPPVTTAAPPTDVYVQAPVEAVWRAALTVMTDLNLSIENIEKASWFLRSEEIFLPLTVATTIDCGTDTGQPRSTLVTVIGRFTILLRPQGDSTAIRLQSVYRGWDGSAPSGLFAGDRRVTCVSTGVEERAILKALAARSGAQPLTESQLPAVPAPPEPTPRVWGLKQTHHFYSMTCSLFGRVQPLDVVLFDSADAAVQAGYSVGEVAECG